MWMASTGRIDGVGEGLVGHRGLDRPVDQVHHPVVVVDLDQPVLRRPLGGEPGLHQRLQGPFDVLLPDQEVDVVVAGVPAVGVHGEAAAQGERDLGLLEHGGDPLQRGKQALVAAVLHRVLPGRRGSVICPVRWRLTGTRHSVRSHPGGHGGFGASCRRAVRRASARSRGCGRRVPCWRWPGHGRSGETATAADRRPGRHRRFGENHSGAPVGGHAHRAGTAGHVLPERGRTALARPAGPPARPTGRPATPGTRRDAPGGVGAPLARDRPGPAPVPVRAPGRGDGPVRRLPVRQHPGPRRRPALGRLARLAYRVFPPPDVTFLLSVTPDEAYRRVEARGTDHESVDFLAAAVAAYRALPEFAGFVWWTPTGTRTR